MYSFINFKGIMGVIWTGNFKMSELAPANSQHPIP